MNGRLSGNHYLMRSLLDGLVMEWLLAVALSVALIFQDFKSFSFPSVNPTTPKAATLVDTGLPTSVARAGAFAGSQLPNLAKRRSSPEIVYRYGKQASIFGMMNINGPCFVPKPLCS